jgi:hypothetical protein
LRACAYARNPYDLLFAATPASLYDHIDVTSYRGLNPDALVAKVGAGYRHRIILSDCKFYLESAADRLAVATWHFDEIRENRLGGWWIFSYKDTPGFTTTPCGIRESGYSGPDGGWKPDILNAIHGDLATPSINNAGPGCADNYCIWIVGHSFAPDSTVELFTLTSSGTPTVVNGLTRSVTADGRQVLTFGITDPNLKNEFATTGLWLLVVNPTAGAMSNFVWAKRP